MTSDYLTREQEAATKRAVDILCWEWDRSYGHAGGTIGIVEVSAWIGSRWTHWSAIEAAYEKAMRERAERMR